MKRLGIYVDSSVFGGCEDIEFSRDSLLLEKHFIDGLYICMISDLTLRELSKAPEAVREHLDSIPLCHQVMIEETEEAFNLANSYLKRGIIGPGSHADALHVALAAIGKADVMVSWNFKHIVNLGKIRLFNAVNMEQGYGLLEIRTPREVLQNGKII